MHNFSNLRPLINDLSDRGWTLSCFTFTYKGIPYVVVAKRFLSPSEKQSKYALAKLEIIDCTNPDRRFLSEANSNGFIASAKEIREFFGIAYRDNIGDILQQLASHINNFMPHQVPNEYSEQEKIFAIESLSKSDSEDPQKIYPLYLKRNSDGRRRSEFNSDKTRLISPRIFEIIKDDTSISCCFTSIPSKEKSVEEILYNFSTNSIS